MHSHQVSLLGLELPNKPLEQGYPTFSSHSLMPTSCSTLVVCDTPVRFLAGVKLLSIIVGALLSMTVGALNLWIWMFPILPSSITTAVRPSGSGVRTLPTRAQGPVKGNLPWLV